MDGPTKTSLLIPSFLPSVKIVFYTVDDLFSQLSDISHPKESGEKMAEKTIMKILISCSTPRTVCWKKDTSQPLVRSNLWFSPLHLLT